MPKVAMTAKKVMKYRGKVLTPGDEFRALNRHAPGLIGSGRAEVEGGTYAAPAPSPETKHRNLRDDDQNGSAGGSRRQLPAPELVQARADYTRITGKRIFSGWSVEELRAKIAAHEAANT